MGELPCSLWAAVSSGGSGRGSSSGSTAQLDSRAVRIAFFDFDKTLIATNSGKLWVKRELRLGYLTKLQALQASLWIAKYHLGFAQVQGAVAKAISMLAGTRERDLRDR